MKYLLLSLILTVFLLFSNCINNIEDVSSGEIIDPTEISFSDDIQTIFNSSCGGSGCHISNTTNGVNLSTYTNVLNSTGASYGSEIVVAGNPNESPLVDKIEANPTFGSRMPLNKSPLSPTEINKIKAWIEGGAENN
ncbi:MAG: hypothetical protein WD016_12755 [Balneolaceae bacterium]